MHGTLRTAQSAHPHSMQFVHGTQGRACIREYTVVVN